MSKGAVWIGATVGAVAGSFVPGLWGAGQLSLWAVVFGTIGGIAGIWAVYKLYN